jgi:hypothetical protein
MSAAQSFRPYIDRLQDDLAAIAADLESLVAISTIRRSRRLGELRLTC